LDYRSWNIGSNLLIMISPSTTGFYEYETLSAFHFAIAQCTTLAMFHSQIICTPIDELKCGQDFRQLPFDDLIEGKNVIEMWQSQNDVV
jgi:hypothetical protein